MKALVRNHPVVAYFALTFTISWGGVLLVIGMPSNRCAARGRGIVRGTRETIRASPTGARRSGRFRTPVVPRAA